MTLSARRALLIRRGIVMGQAHFAARNAGWHVAAVALLVSFRAAWGSDTLPRRAFERVIEKGYNRG